MNPDDLQNFFTLILGGLYAAFGGMIHFLYQSSKTPHHAFKWMLFFVNILVAFYVGQVAWEFLPEGTPSKGGIMMLAGFLAYPILDFFERNGVRYIVKKVFNFKD